MQITGTSIKIMINITFFNKGVLQYNHELLLSLYQFYCFHEYYCYVSEFLLVKFPIFSVKGDGSFSILPIVMIIFGYSYVCHNIFVVCDFIFIILFMLFIQWLCSFCVFHVKFISCLWCTCCWCWCKPYKIYWKHEITSIRHLLATMFVCLLTQKRRTINNKIMILPKNDELFLCGAKIWFENVPWKQNVTITNKKVSWVWFWNTQALPCKVK